MMLNSEQRTAIAKGEAIRLTDEDLPIVVLRADVYEQLKARADDDTVYTTAEMMDELMAEDDANDPFLAELQQKYKTP